MAPPTQWRWVWVDSRSWWWTGRPGVLWSMGSQRVGYNWVTELNWIGLVHLPFRQIPIVPSLPNPLLFFSGTTEAILEIYNYAGNKSGFPGSRAVKNPPAIQETKEALVGFLGQEDPPEEEMATHSSIPAWTNPMARGAWWATVRGITKSQTWLSDWAQK